MKRKRESVSVSVEESMPMDDEMKFKADMLQHLSEIGSERRTIEYNAVNGRRPHDIDEMKLRDMYNEVFMRFFPEDAHRVSVVVDRYGDPLGGGKTKRNRRRHSRRSLKRNRKYTKRR